MPTLSDPFFESLKPSDDRPIHEWAERSIFFGSRQPAVKRGWLTFEMTPYSPHILAAMKDKRIRIVVIKAPAQVAKTTTLLVWLCWLACENPGPATVVMASQKAAEQAVDERFVPMIEDSPVVNAAVMPTTREKFPLRKDKQIFKGMQIQWIGPNSIADATGRPAKNLYLDELNKYKEILGNESSVIQMLINRSASFWDSKICLSSTVTTADDHISVWYDRTNKIEWRFVCPHCSAAFFPQFDMLKWSFGGNEPLRKHCECWVECPNGCRIPSSRRQEMLGKSVPFTTETNPKDDRYWGIAIHGLSSPFRPWEDFVMQFLQVRENPEELKNFKTEWCGEEWVEKRIVVQEDQLDARRVDYMFGADPKDAPFFREKFAGLASSLFVGVDVQKDHFWVAVRRYWSGGHSALVGFWKVYSWEELEARVDTLSKSDETWIGIDSGDGNRTSEIYEACLRFGYIPTKGSSKSMPMPFTQSTVNPMEGTREQEEGRSLQLIIYDTHQAKTMLSSRQVGESWGGWYIPKDTPREYDLQVTAEQYNETRGEWQVRPGRKHNHAVDAECIADTIAKLAGLNVPEIVKPG